jgi:hypothetical protein
MDLNTEVVAQAVGHEGSGEAFRRGFFGGHFQDACFS